MTNQQKIEAIAKACDRKPTGQFCPKCYRGVPFNEQSPLGKTHVICGSLLHNDGIPHYLTDANCRQEMLEVMSEEQAVEMIVKIRRSPEFNGLAFRSETEWAYMCLSVGQPLFADCWLQAIGLWKGDV